MKKLNMRGFSHDLLIVAFVVVFAISGVAALVASHADSKSPTGKLKVQVEYQGRLIKTGHFIIPQYAPTEAVSSAGGKAYGCQGGGKNGLYPLNRAVKCTVGHYQIHIDKTKVQGKKDPIYGDATADVRDNKTTTVTIHAHSGSESTQTVTIIYGD